MGEWRPRIHELSTASSGYPGVASRPALHKPGARTCAYRCLSSPPGGARANLPSVSRHLIVGLELGLVAVVAGGSATEKATPELGWKAIVTGLREDVTRGARARP